MYCIECGLQIPENSKFCSHCGENQTEVKSTLKKEPMFKSSINTRYTRELIGWYLVWVALHLGFLLIFAENIFPFGDDSFQSDSFWPFGSDRLITYDIREFLVYTISPLAYVFISLIFHKPKSTDSN